MSQFRGVATIAGITATTNNNAFAGQQFKSNDLVYQQGFFGYSTTSVVAGQTWQLNVFNLTGTGAKLSIAGVSGIGGVASSGFIPVVDANGTTQSAFIGIPRPDGVDVIGSSAGVGITLGVVVTANLVNT